MAEGFEEAIKFIEVLDKGSELISSFEAVSSALKIFGTFAPGFSFLGAALGLIDAFLPDVKHEQILRCFEKLSTKIHQVRDDIKNLEKMIKWEVTKIQYAKAVQTIQIAMAYSLEMGRANKTGDQNKYNRYQARLTEACSCNQFASELDSLLTGISGNGVFYSSILETMYSETGGHRPKISALAFRLLQIVSGGLIVLATYEASVRGKEGAEEMVRHYERKLNDAKSKIIEVLERCKEEFRATMLQDINRLLDSGGDNEYICDNMFRLVKEKYDWLEISCVVYNGLLGFAKHCFTGSCVDSLNRNGKCAIVFYREASDAPICSDRVDDVERIVSAENFSNARRRCEALFAELDKAGIGWSGCAVIGSHVSERNNMSSKAVLKVFKWNYLRREMSYYTTPIGCETNSRIGGNGTIIVILQ